MIRRFALFAAAILLSACAPEPQPEPTPAEQQAALIARGDSLDIVPIYSERLQA